MANEESQSGWIGRTVGGYRLVAQLGSGAMGAVFVGEGPGGSAAVKILDGELGRIEGAKERFLREARAASAIAHPHIAQVRQAGRSECGELFLAMELLEGETLAAALSRGPLAARTAAQIGWQIADALVAVHATGTVHRDLKPHNVFLCDRGRTAKLLDFGIARVTGSDATATGIMMGTPYYVAPEQARSARRADAAADAYAFGVMLYEATTGRVPFSGPTVYEVLRQHEECAPPAPSRYATMPAELERLILRCLEKDPARRPSMHVARDALRALSLRDAEEPTEESTVDDARILRAFAITSVSVPRQRRARWLLAAGIAAWLAIAVIAGVLVTR